MNFPDTIKIYDNFLPDYIINTLYQRLGDELRASDFELRRSGITADGKFVLHTNTMWNLHGTRIPPPPPTQELLAYNFLTTSEHKESCNCAYCDLVQIFEDNLPDELQGLILDDSYLSVYRPGDFLNRHHDGHYNSDMRQWAFTLTLTKDWLPDYGGILNVQDPDDGEWYAFPPVFNRLILMDVTLREEKLGMNHFVSHVHPNVTLNRLTYSGWYRKKAPEDVDVPRKADRDFDKHHD